MAVYISSNNCHIYLWSMDDYITIGLIGRGGCGEAILVTHRDDPGELRVVKRIDISLMTAAER